MVYLFDVDGTLTPIRQRMTDDFAQKFIPFLEKNICYVVSGSDLQKIKEQMPKEVLEKFTGLFCAMGNELYIKDSLIYANEFTPIPELLKDLEKIRLNTQYPYQLYDSYIELRKGVLNFSTIGRNCPYDEREKYAQWDAMIKEREGIKSYLESKYTNYDIAIGGQISIDINPKGKGKEQVISYLRNIYHKEMFLFFGDMVQEGGNDYGIAKYCLTVDKNAKVIEVTSQKQLLNNLSLL